jgi:hypothetical protein
MTTTFMRRVHLDFTKDLIPQLVELAEDTDEEVAKWAQENLRNEIERAKFTAWLAKRGIDGRRLTLEEPSLFEQFRAEHRPKLAVVRKDLARPSRPRTLTTLKRD